MQKGLSDLTLRLLKFIVSMTIITLAALVYVHQQIELVKLSYAIDQKEKKVEHMLDYKEGLGYNIKELENPSRLEKVLVARKIDMVFPKRGQVVTVRGIPSNAKIGEQLKTIGLERKTNIFRIFEFLGLNREAQAKEK